MPFIIYLFAIFGFFPFFKGCADRQNIDTKIFQSQAILPPQFQIISASYRQVEQRYVLSLLPPGQLDPQEFSEKNLYLGFIDEETYATIANLNPTRSIFDFETLNDRNKALFTIFEERIDTEDGYKPISGAITATLASEILLIEIEIDRIEDQGQLALFIFDAYIDGIQMISPFVHLIDTVQGETTTPESEYPGSNDPSEIDSTLENSHLSISEIYFRTNKGSEGDPNGDGIPGTNSDRFIELLNADSQVIDMKDIRIVDIDSGNTLYTFSTYTLKPYSNIVIFGGDFDERNQPLLDHVTNNFPSPDSKNGIALAQNDRIIDEVNWILDSRHKGSYVRPFPPTDRMVPIKNGIHSVGR